MASVTSIAARITAAQHPRAHGRLHARKLQRRTPSAAATDATDAAAEGEALWADDRVPVTVITGFLGSGKTTLINRILTADHGKRIAVIENEFGAIGIDDALIATRAGSEADDDIVVMLNGCVCCTVRQDLIATLSDLVTNKREKFDHIIIETTGLANPAPVVQSFYLDPLLEDELRLDGVVTMVDARHAEMHLDEEKPEGVVNEALEQVAFADRLVLNKCDLADETALNALEGRLRSINAIGSLRRSINSEVDMDYLLGIGGFDIESVEESMRAMFVKPDEVEAEAESGSAEEADCTTPGCTDPSHDHSHSHTHSHSEGCSEPGCTDPKHDHSHTDAHGGADSEAECSTPGCTDPTHDHSHGHGHTHTHHDDAVTSVSLQLEGDLDLEMVNSWLEELLTERNEDIFRMKGILSIQDVDERFVFQGVHQLFEGIPSAPWREGEARVSRLVFIGKNLVEEDFSLDFQACRAGLLESSS